MAEKTASVNIEMTSSASINATVERFEQIPPWKQKLLLWLGTNFKNTLIGITVGAFITAVFATWGAELALWLLQLARSASG